LLAPTHHRRLRLRLPLLVIVVVLPLLAPGRVPLGRVGRGGRTGIVRLHFLSGGLRTGAGAAPSGAAAAPALALEAARAGRALAVLALSLEPAAAAVGGAAPAVAAVVGASVGAGLRAALLHDDVLAVDGVRVRGYGCVVAGCVLELDERAVLYAVSSSSLQTETFSTDLTFWRFTSK